VFKFSLLSNCTLVVELPVSMKPLFAVPDSQLITAAVASTVMKVLAVVAGTAVATATPGEMPESPFTVDSVQGVEALTVSILNVPPTPT
jgi:hypothetical protein